MNFGLLVLSALRVKFTQQREYMSALELWESSRPINLLKVGVGSPFSFKSTLTEVWNILALLTSTARLLIPFLKFFSFQPKRNRNYRYYGN